MLVYLAGPLTGMLMEATTYWRSVVTADFGMAGISTLSPTRGMEFIKPQDKINTTYAEYVAGSDKAMVSRDRWDLMRADVVLANLLHEDRVSIGTMVELGWADAFRMTHPKLIVVVMRRNGLYEHSFVREIATHITDSLSVAVDLITEFDVRGGQQ